MGDQDQFAGAWVGQPIRYCVPADGPLRSLSLWSANYTAVKIGKTTAGIVSKGECQSGQLGTLWIMQRGLSGDLSRQYRFFTESHLEQAGKPAQWTQRVETINRFIGPCEEAARKAVPNSIKRPEGAWAILGFALVFVLQLMALVGLIYATYRGMAWLSLRLGRRAYERAVVANITVDEAGAATILVLATFTGVRGLPWWYAIASNNAKPLLVIEPVEGVAAAHVANHTIVADRGWRPRFATIGTIPSEITC